MTPRVRWSLVATVALALFGIFVGGLMTWHHDTQLYGADAEKGELFGCAESAEVNCDIVNTSAWSELGGVPIATLAIPFYATVALLGILGLRGRPGVRTLLLAAGIGAVAYSGLLFYVSKTELGYVCAWCIRLYLTNAGILGAALVGGQFDRPDRGLIGTALAAWAGLGIAAASGERLYRDSLSGGAPATRIAASGADHSHDPEGDAPTLSIAVVTEDKTPGQLTIEADDAWHGNPAARVTVVMFGDLECGYCKRSAAEMSRLEATYGDRVLFVFKHFPLDPACNPGVKNRKHRDACRAAAASVCAQEQGRFWAFHDLAYKNQHQLGDAYLRTYATQAGADPAAFDACMASDRPLAVVRHDAEAGQAIATHGTPRIWIDGKLYRSGTSAEAMARAIELALGADPADAARAAAAMREADAIPPVPADVPASRQLTVGDLTFRIDTFEAAIEGGEAVSGKHAIPALDVTWYDAKAACEAAGRRLCTEEEWVSACQGARARDDNANGELADDMIEGTAYPYGDYHAPGRCWDAQDPAVSRPVYTGEMPGCVTAGGVYDLTGNVEEWVGDTPEHAVLLGGAFDTSEDHARCYRRNDTFGAGYSAPRTGFRCCGP